MKHVRILLLGLLALGALSVGSAVPIGAWIVPTAVNTNAGIDSGTDFAPQIATDGTGGGW